MSSDYKPLEDGIDEFEALCSGVKQAETQVVSLINSREIKLQKNENIFQTDKDLRVSLKSYFTFLNQLQNLIINYQSKKCSLLPQEIQRRRNIVNEMQNKYTSLREKATTKDKKSPQEELFSSKTQNTQTSQKGKTNVELMQIQKDLVQNQNSQVDALLDQVDRIGNHTKIIKVALEEDKVVMSNLNKKVENTNTEIKAAETRLHQFLARTSNCCLWTTIMIQLMIFIMLIIY